MNDKKNIKVFVAMSGGVDSSVAAALLKYGKFSAKDGPASGWDVVGVFLKPWQPSFAKSYGGQSQFDCLWKEDREYALRAAMVFDIPLLTWDFSKEYEKHVAEYMIEGYRQGITPNPDVMCNKFIKFGVFLNRALELGADYIATGHYVRKVGSKLLKAKDANKDQSYFLYTLTQKQLKHCLFPIGGYRKEEVRKMAKKFGLPNWNKKDSQGVCFIGPLDIKEFLKKYIKPRKGLVVRKSDGEILGEHDGIWYYTIGQRHGLNLSAGKPYYVVDKNPDKNILFVDEEIKSRELEIRIKDFNWIDKINLPIKCKVKTRYRQKDLDCFVVKNGGASVYAKIKNSKVLVASGQAAVFYKGNEVLGGGTIV